MRTADFSSLRKEGVLIIWRHLSHPKTLLSGPTQKGIAIPSIDRGIVSRWRMTEVALYLRCT